MSRIVVIAIVAIVLFVGGVALLSTGFFGQPDETVATEPEIVAPELDEPALADDGSAPAANETAEAATGEVDEVIAEITAIAERQSDGEVERENDEAALDAPAIGPPDAVDPAFLARAFSPETFEAERAVTAIDAHPDLSDDDKAELRRAVQVVSQRPEALEEVLPMIERVLLSAD